MRRRVVCLPCSRGDGALHRTLAPPSLTSLFHSPSVLTCFMKLTSTFFAMTSGAERERNREQRPHVGTNTRFMFGHCK